MLGRSFNVVIRPQSLRDLLLLPLVNALFLKDLAAKTHRGIRGRVEKGKSGGGLG